ncbi:uncharacterized mitochondrial protein-like protein [Tanacetum coccineum]
MPVETSTFIALVSCDGLGGYDWSDQAEEGPNYALMAYSSSSFDSKVSNDSNCSKSCMETVKLLKSQNDQLLRDLEKSWLMVLDEFVNKHVVENYKAMCSEEEPKVVRKYDDALSIEEWVSDNEEEDVSQPKTKKKIVRPSIVKKEYEEIDGGYVAFGGKPKGGKIIGKKVYLPNFKNDQNMSLLIKRESSTEPLWFSESIPIVIGQSRKETDLSKIVRVPFGDKILIFHGDGSNNGHESRLNIISCTKTQKYLLKGCPIFLAHVTTKKAKDKSKEKRPDDVPIVQDFLEVFPEDLPGIPPTRQVEFQIDLIPGAALKEDNVNNTNNVNAAGINEVNAVGRKTSIELLVDPNMPALEDYSIFDSSKDDEDDSVEADMNNLDTTIQVSHNPTTRIHKDHPLNQVIGDFKSSTQTRRMSKNLEEHGRTQKGNSCIEGSKLDRGYAGRASTIQVTRSVDIGAFLYGKIEEEVYVCQPPRFDDPNFPDRMSSMGELTFFLGLQVQQKKDGIFISQDKYVAEILKKFGFTEVKTASTPMETQKPLLKDEDGEEVDVHMYRSMIGSLMYLTSSRPDIMFVVYACARYQVNPKVSHLHAMKRIFRYLKGQPKLGLWYPKDSPFDLVAYTDSDYAGASLDRKSTIGGCQFLGCRLISWQCKKQIVVANSLIEAKYMAASSCCG